MSPSLPSLLKSGGLALILTLSGPALAEPTPTGAPAPPAGDDDSRSASTEPTTSASNISAPDDRASKAASTAPSPEAAEVAPPANDRRAARDADARAHFLEGDRLYLEGDYEAAALEFQKAYALSGRIEMLFNLANAYERIGLNDRAAEALRGYIPHAPETGRPALEKRLVRLEERAAADRLALQRSDEPPPPETSPPVADSKIDVGTAVGYGLIGLGVVGVGIGSAFGVSALNARDEADDLCREVSGHYVCPEEAREALERDQSHSLIADISIAAGLLSAAGGVYLVLSRSDHDEVVATVRPGGILVSTSF